MFVILMFVWYAEKLRVGWGKWNMSVEHVRDKQGQEDKSSWFSFPCFFAVVLFCFFNLKALCFSPQNLLMNVRIKEKIEFIGERLTKAPKIALCFRKPCSAIYLMIGDGGGEEGAGNTPELACIALATTGNVP